MRDAYVQTVMALKRGLHHSNRPFCANYAFWTLLNEMYISCSGSIITFMCNIEIFCCLTKLKEMILF